MNAATAIPLTVTSDAAARIAELGMQTEFEQMLEHARQTIQGLQRFEVILVPPHDTGDDPGVVIEAIRPAVSLPTDAEARHEWRDWLLETFSPDVWRHFVLWTLDGTNHVG